MSCATRDTPIQCGAWPSGSAWWVWERREGLIGPDDVPICEP